MLERYYLAFGCPAPAGVPDRAGILPVPYDRTASYQSGARRAPDAIIQASFNMEFYDEVLGLDPSRLGVVTYAPLEPHADGPRAMMDRVAMKVGEILDAGVLPVVLGGDHAISVGAVESVLARRPLASVLHLDAHADMRDEWEGSRWSHACVMRRIRDLCPALSLGVRSMCEEDAEVIAGRELAVHSVRSWRNLGPQAFDLLHVLGPEVYITFDVDVLDPSIMPATGTPEPGGFSWEEMDDILAWVTGNRRVIGFDVVELMPVPAFVAPDYLVARLVYRLIGRVLAGQAAQAGVPGSGQRRRGVTSADRQE